jgi:deoxyribodipyrimidine photolyase-related protein
MTAALIYPHQLFVATEWLSEKGAVYLVEDPLFFTQYRFHRQKLLLHRASMQSYADDLRTRGWNVKTIEASTLKDSSDIAKRIQQEGHREVQCIDPEDDYLLRKLARGCESHGLDLKIVGHPDFLTSVEDIHAFTRDRSKLLFTQFYIEQRKRLGLLLDSQGKPLAGKWSLDSENRKKLPKGIAVPDSPLARESSPVTNRFALEASHYIDRHFPNALGEHQPLLYPCDRDGSVLQLQQFIQQRLSGFGDYEDAISREHTVLFHSVLTPMLNIGLLSPQQVLDAVLMEQQRIPINALEGFVRQIIGWREYMRLVYRTMGTAQRTRNYWNHTRPLPKSFYDGTTGIEPIDHTIRRVLCYGYCHHIERLMILGNFMLLCEFHPDAIYQWFMEMFVDAYDWVMVPNVYGMSQHADGGAITTKPYISGSSYVLKMSDYKKGPWCDVWDGLYWRFIDRNRSFFESNPRMKVMTGQLDRMGDKLKKHRDIADTFLSNL